ETPSGNTVPRPSNDSDDRARNDVTWTVNLVVVVAGNSATPLASKRSGASDPSSNRIRPRRGAEAASDSSVLRRIELSAVGSGRSTNRRGDPSEPPAIQPVSGSPSSI